MKNKFIKLNNKNILISMCLVGISCRYNATPSKTNISDEILNNNNLIPVCPEQLGGLTTPRCPAEIQYGDSYSVLDKTVKVLNQNSDDVTDNYIFGASQTLLLCKKFNAEFFIGQPKSPSCSCYKVYDGTFSRKLIPGLGVTSALLKQNGITIIDINA